MEERPRLRDFRLPPGRHGIPREQVSQNQRWRLIGAAGEVLLVRGYRGLSTAEISEVAAVSRSTFYGQFANRDECLLVAFEAAADSLLQLASGPCRRGYLEPAEKVDSALDSIFGFLANEPASAAMLGAEAPAAVPMIAVARERLIEELAARLREARGFAVEQPSHADRILIAGAFALASRLISEHRFDALPRLGAELGELIAVGVWTPSA